MLKLSDADMRALEDGLFAKLTAIANQPGAVDAEVDAWWERPSRLCAGFQAKRGFAAWARDELRHRGVTL